MNGKVLGYYLTGQTTTRCHGWLCTVTLNNWSNEIIVTALVAVLRGSALELMQTIHAHRITLQNQQAT